MGLKLSARAAELMFTKIGIGITVAIIIFGSGGAWVSVRGSVKANALEVVEQKSHVRDLFKRAETLIMANAKQMEKHLDKDVDRDKQVTENKEAIKYIKEKLKDNSSKLKDIWEFLLRGKKKEGD